MQKMKKIDCSSQTIGNTALCITDCYWEVACDHSNGTKHNPVAATLHPKLGGSTLPHKAKNAKIDCNSQTIGNMNSMPTHDKQYLIQVNEVNLITANVAI